MRVSEAREAGRIRPYAGRILGNVFRISRTRVRDVMVPHDQVFAVEVSEDPDNLHLIGRVVALYRRLDGASILVSTTAH